MTVLAMLSIGLLMYQCINVLINLIWMQRIKAEPQGSQSRVSVLIPARNEESNIGLLLSDLTLCRDELFEILVYDDDSTDNTAEIVSAFARKEPKIRLIRSVGLPDDWLGKNHACHQLAQEAGGDCFLFLDSDVRILPTMIRDSVAELRRKKLGLMSVFPRQIQQTWGEKMTVPIMNYVLITLLPLIFVRISSFKSHVAANGQFLLFDATVYLASQPHAKYRHSRVEDLDIAGDFKKQGVRLACLAVDKRLSCRMYHSYKEALHGFSKNVLSFFGNKPFLAVGFWLLVSLGFIPVYITAQTAFMAYIFGVLVVVSIYSLVSKQSLLVNLLLYPVHLLFLLHVMLRAMSLTHQNKVTWKGRSL